MAAAVGCQQAQMIHFDCQLVVLVIGLQYDLLEQGLVVVVIVLEDALVVRSQLLERAIVVDLVQCFGNVRACHLFRNSVVLLLSITSILDLERKANKWT